jgi:hypothetical protein
MELLFYGAIYFLVATIILTGLFVEIKNYYDKPNRNRNNDNTYHIS